jgi:hypothetical protein
MKREVLYYILTEFGVPMKLLQLIKMCLNETYKAHIGKHLSDSFLIQNGLKQERRCFNTIAFQSMWDWNWMRHISFQLILMSESTPR